MSFSETWSPLPFRRRSSGKIKNLTTVSSSSLPAFGTVVDQDGYHQLKKYVIAPYDRRYRLWQTFLVGLVIYSAWVSPFEVGFKKAADGGLIDLVVDFFFATDILFTFFVAYFDKSTYLLVDDHNQIALRYVTKFYFPMDVASTIPFQFMYGRIHQGEVFGFFNLLRIWRLRHVISELFKRLEKDTQFGYFSTRLIKLVCVTLFAVHSAGCFYYWLAVHHKVTDQTWIGSEVKDFKHRSMWLGYTYSIYWSIVTLTTVAFTAYIIVHSFVRNFAKKDHVAAGLCCIQLFMNSVSQEEAVKHLEHAKVHFDDELLARYKGGDSMKLVTKGNTKFTEEELVKFSARVSIQVEVVKSFNDLDGPQWKHSLFENPNDPKTFRRRCEIAETLVEKNFDLAFQVIHEFNLPAIDIYTGVAASLAERKKGSQLTEFFRNIKGTIDDDDLDQVLGAAINVYANKHKERPDCLIDMLTSSNM